MIRLSIPGMIMVEAEWFAFEILTLATGQFGSEYLATQSILMTITSTTFQIPFPIAIAASTRVANLIGAGLVDAAKTCAKVVSHLGFFFFFSLADQPLLHPLYLFLFFFLKKRKNENESEHEKEAEKGGYLVV